MRINELNAYSVVGSALGKSPPIWTPETGCFLLSRADNPKTKSPVNSSFTRLLLHLARLFAAPHLCGGLLCPPPLAVRRGFYPNPRNTPCIKRLHALPNEAGYTLVTRFHTSKSASMNALSMNLYTANVASFSGTCKLLSLNIFNSYRLFCLLFFMFATGSETAQ